MEQGGVFGGGAAGGCVPLLLAGFFSSFCKPHQPRLVSLCVGGVLFIPSVGLGQLFLPLGFLHCCSPEQCAALAGLWLPHLSHGEQLSTRLLHMQLGFSLFSLI